jgi:hypothetical protein
LHPSKNDSPIVQGYFVMKFKHLAIATVITAIPLIAATAPAQATAYANNNIYLELKEAAPGIGNAADGPTGPIGTATYKRGTWTGSVIPVAGGVIPLPNVLDSQGYVDQGARRLFVGTFTESHPKGPGCTGDITILRHSQGQGAGVDLARITRTITGGNSTTCVSGTTTVEETMSPRPVRNSAGDFTALQANKLKNNSATWWRWMTTTNSTQCRDNLSNSSPFELLSGTGLNQLNARFGNGTGNQIFLDSSNNPWLKIRKPSNPSAACYVRANISDIQAVYLGF